MRESALCALKHLYKRAREDIHTLKNAAWRGAEHTTHSEKAWFHFSPGPNKVTSAEPGENAVYSTRVSVRWRVIFLIVLRTQDAWRRILSHSTRGAKILEYLTLTPQWVDLCYVSWEVISYSKWISLCFFFT